MTPVPPPPPAPVAVYGEMLIDHFPTGRVVGGAPFNVARHLAAFGVAPLMLGAIGDDPDGRLVLAEFDRFGLRREGLQVLGDRSTGVVHVDGGGPGGHRFRIGGACAWDFIDKRAVDALRSHAARPAWLYHGTLSLRSARSRDTWRALVAAHEGPVFLDLNWRDGEVPIDVALEAVAVADVLKVNDDELAMLASLLGLAIPADDRQEDASLRALARRFGLRLIVVTAGARGHAAFDGDGSRVAAGPSESGVDVVDTVGAGDAFSAVVLAGLSCGWPLDLALQRAGRFAARVCALRGAVPDAPAWYDETLAEWRSGPEPLTRRRGG
jgi:fructokinase